MAEPAAMPIDVEGASGQPSGPDVLIDDEIAAASFGLISYLVGNALFAEYLQIRYVAGTGELAVLCGAVIGASLDLVHDAVGHRGEDRLDVAVMFGAKLPVHEAIEVLLLHHRTHSRPRR